MGTSRARTRPRGNDDVLAAKGLEAWQAEPLADALAAAFDTEVSERHTRDGKIDVYVAASRKVPDEDGLAAFVQGALAMLDQLQEDEEAGELEEDLYEDEDEPPSSEDERPRRRGRLWPSRRASFATPADARQRPLPTPGNSATTRPVPPRDG